MTAKDPIILVHLRFVGPCRKTAGSFSTARLIYFDTLGIFSEISVKDLSDSNRKLMDSAPNVTLFRCQSSGAMHGTFAAKKCYVAGRIQQLVRVADKVHHSGILWIPLVLSPLFLPPSQCYQVSPGDAEKCYVAGRIQELLRVADKFHHSGILWIPLVLSPLFLPPLTVLPGVTW